MEVGPDTFSGLFQIRTKGRKFSVTRDIAGKIKPRRDEWPHTKRVFLTRALRYFHCWVGWLPSLVGTQTLLAMMTQMPCRCSQCALSLRQQTAAIRCDKDTNKYTHAAPWRFPSVSWKHMNTEKTANSEMSMLLSTKAGWWDSHALCLCRMILSRQCASLTFWRWLCL